MIHLTKTKSKHFIVVVTGKNGEVLMQSELLDSKQSAWKNIGASAEIFLVTCIYVQDDTLEIPLQWTYLKQKGKWELSDCFEAEEPKYIPGKNKKKSSPHQLK